MENLRFHASWNWTKQKKKEIPIPLELGQANACPYGPALSFLRRSALLYRSYLTHEVGNRNIKKERGN